jgi:hypothetical protein
MSCFFYYYYFVFILCFPTVHIHIPILGLVVGVDRAAEGCLGGEKQGFWLLLMPSWRVAVWL